MLKFTKMTGLGNDYIYVDCTNGTKFRNIPEMAKKLSNRHFGVGSDGLILIDKPDNEQSDFKMRIFNSDGSEAEMCGNGIRCMAKYIHDNGLSRKDKISIDTIAGIKKVKILEDAATTVDVQLTKKEANMLFLGEYPYDKLPENIKDLCKNWFPLPLFISSSDQV